MTLFNNSNTYLIVIKRHNIVNNIELVKACVKFYPRLFCIHLFNYFDIR